MACQLKALDIEFKSQATCLICRNESSYCVVWHSCLAAPHPGVSKLDSDRSWALLLLTTLSGEAQQKGCVVGEVDVAVAVEIAFQRAVGFDQFGGHNCRRKVALVRSIGRAVVVEVGVAVIHQAIATKIGQVSFARKTISPNAAALFIQPGDSIARVSPPCHS